MNGARDIADPFLVVHAIEILTDRQARLGTCSDNGVVGWMVTRKDRYRHDPLSAPYLAVAQFMALYGDVRLAHVVPSPARISLRFPVIVIGRLSPDIDHAVDRARPSEGLAANPDLLLVRTGDVFDGVGPKKIRVVSQFDDPLGHRD